MYTFILCISINISLFFYNHPPTTQIYTLSLHDALPIFALLGMRAKNARQAGELSGMAQSIGYVFAAVGPILIGLLFDLTHNWTVPLIALVLVSILLTIAGFGAGRNKHV